MQVNSATIASKVISKIDNICCEPGDFASSSKISKKLTKVKRVDTSYCKINTTALQYIST